MPPAEPGQHRNRPPPLTGVSGRRRTRRDPALFPALGFRKCPKEPKGRRRLRRLRPFGQKVTLAGARVPVRRTSWKLAPSLFPPPLMVSRPPSLSKLPSFKTEAAGAYKERSLPHGAADDFPVHHDFSRPGSSARIPAACPDCAGENGILMGPGSLVLRPRDASAKAAASYTVRQTAPLPPYRGKRARPPR